VWFEIARRLGLDAVAVADLDAVFEPSFRRSMDCRSDVRAMYETECLASPPTTAKVLGDIYSAMHSAGVPPESKARAEWLATLDSEGGGLFHRKARLLETWRSSGIWLHPQGTLEAVLGLTEKASPASARTAAQSPGPIDAVAEFCRFRTDSSLGLREALTQEVRRIAQNIQRAQSREPELRLSAPYGATAVTDARLVNVAPFGEDGHRLVVKAPDEFRGWFVDFGVSTPVTDINLAEATADSPILDDIRTTQSQALPTISGTTGAGSDD